MERIIRAGSGTKIGLMRIFEHGPRGLQMIAAGRGVVGGVAFGVFALGLWGVYRVARWARTAAYIASGARSISPGQATAPCLTQTCAKNCSSRSGARTPVSS